MIRKYPHFFLVGLALLAGALVFFARPALAQNPQPTPSDDEVNRVARQMFCPVCENVPLDVCPTQACHDWRELIRQKLAAGWTDQQIKDYFAVQYGDRVLSEPPRRGLNWLVYILPVVALAAGVFIVWRVLVTMRHNAEAARTLQGGPAAPAAPGQPSAAPDDPYMRQLEEELRKKD